LFSSLDIKAGFHNIPVHPDSVKLTAFVTQDGTYEMKRMSFGFRGAPAHF
jgi:hypothetical protein